MIKFITRLEMQARVSVIREELETRHKYGTVKLANSDGEPVSTEKLQNELYSLIYKLGKID
jgi:hypothetical protein